MGLRGLSPDVGKTQGCGCLGCCFGGVPVLGIKVLCGAYKRCPFALLGCLFCAAWYSPPLKGSVAHACKALLGSMSPGAVKVASICVAALNGDTSLFQEPRSGLLGRVIDRQGMQLMSEPEMPAFYTSQQVSSSVL